MSSFPRRALAIYLPVAALLTFTCALGYGLVQQDLRTGANDPQLQMAEDAATALNAGAAPATLLGTAKVDVARSLAPFTVIFNSTGAVVATDGVLDGHDPIPPTGVLDGARLNPPNTVTWQPRPGVRIAQASVPWTGGTVLVGRSLREVERREDQLLLLVAAAWLVGLAGTAGASVVAAWIWPKGEA